MKPAKKAIALAVITTAILMFWIMPGINKGNQTGYVRYYEDTDAGKGAAKVLPASHFNRADTTQRRHRKIMKREIIELRKSGKISPAIFSRAMQFEPLTEQDSILLDSLDVVLR